jgi:hypothetical protein
VESILQASAPQPLAASELVVNPFLHFGGDRVYNPITDETLHQGELRFAALHRVMAGELAAGLLPGAMRGELARGGWLVRDAAGASREFRLKYVSLEAHTVCNQACYFCPVSFAPREDYFMPTALYERIVGELAAWRDTIEAVFMISYNEPTVDRRFVDQVRTIKAAGLPPAVLTNGTGLTPARVDALVELGGLRYLSVNLSTLDRGRYTADRQGDHLDLVLRHLDHAKSLPVAEQMEVIVLGRGDEAHREDFARIGERFAGSRFTVKSYQVMDRAGYLQIGLRPPAHDAPPALRGCENVGSRPLQHLHVTPHGKCVFCCEDYDERYVVGDLERSSVAEVLAGPEPALLRRWAYGVEDAPANFICRKCVFARTA